MADVELIDRKALADDIKKCCRESYGACCGVCGLIEKAPVVDAVPVAKDLRAVIKQLENEYDRAKSLEYVRNPLAFALYRVWKNVDR